jgi:hypothetical protein
MLPVRQTATAVTTALQAVPLGALAFHCMASDVDCTPPLTAAMTLLGACACGFCYVCHTKFYPTHPTFNQLPRFFSHGLRLAGATALVLVAVGILFSMMKLHCADEHERKDKIEATLKIQIPNIERIVFDEGSARFDNVSHETGEDLIGRNGVINGNLQ